ncbi:MAG: hypothetical protein ACKVQS_09335 [Fimbriimonadaceae bacterium]
MTSIALAIAYTATTLTPGPAQILSEAMEHYYNAGNMSGTISTTLSEGTVVQKIQTQLQFSSPDRLYFEQTPASDPSAKILAISNGTHLVYPSPEEFDSRVTKRPYFVEPIIQKNGGLMTIQTMYSIFSRAVVDRSIPLEIAIGRDKDLQVIARLLSNFSDGGVRSYNGEDVNVVLCDVVHQVGSEFKLKGAFFINDKRDIRYFKVFGIMKDSNKKSVEFTAEWIVNLEVNNKDAIKPALYNLDLVNK